MAGKNDFIGPVPSRPNRQMINADSTQTLSARSDIARGAGDFAQPGGYHPAHRKLVSHEPLESIGGHLEVVPSQAAPKQFGKSTVKHHHHFRRLKVILLLLLLLAVGLYLAIY